MKSLLGLTALLGGLGVILGALGAHALKNVLSAEQLASFKTGVLYQMMHVLAILGVASLSQLDESQKVRVIQLFLAGMVLFSGSIYLLVLTGITTKWIALLTPLGGLLFIAGWFMLAYYLFK